MKPLRAAVAARSGAGFISLGQGEMNHLVTAEYSRVHHRNQSVKLVTLKQAWSELPPRTGRVHVLAVDAEGAEKSILGAGDMPAPPPELVLYEHSHLSLAARRRIAANLLRQGYEKLAELKHQTPKGRGQGPQNQLYGRVGHSSAPVER